MKNQLINKKNILIALFITFLIEIFLFNIWSITSLFSKEIVPKYEISNGFKCDKNNCIVTDPSGAYIEIKNVKKNWKKIYFDIVDDSQLYNLQIYSQKKDSKYFLPYEKVVVYPETMRSKYINLNDSDDIQNIRIYPLSNIEFNEITINKNYPFTFNIYRLIIVFVLIYSILTFRPSISLTNNNYIFFIKSSCIIGILLLLSGIYLTTKGNYKYNHEGHQTKYFHLAEALAQNDVKLGIPVTKKLKTVENPYSKEERDKTLIIGKDYYWDYAYFNESYYCYFGIVPAIMFYLPFYLITGNHISHAFALFVSIGIFLVSVFTLLFELKSRYFNKISDNWILVLSLFISLGSLSFVLRGPNFYNIPIILGVAFTILGLTLWLKATKNKEINKTNLYWGSMFMALVAGCRPQLLLASFLSFWIFKDYLKKWKQYIKEILIFVFPYIFIGIFIMTYNYVRFGSIFDFGATYNLTTNDMTSRNFSIARMITSTYSYLFEPIRFKPSFPFIYSFDLKSIIKTNAKIIWEPLVGGFYFLNTISILGLLSLFLKKKFKNKSLWIFTILLNIIGIIIMLLDSHIAGILPRYYNDFGFLFNISASITILTLLNNKNNSKLKYGIASLIFVSIILNVLLIFDPALV